MYLFYGSYAAATALGYLILILVSTKDDHAVSFKPVVEKWIWVKSVGGYSGKDSLLPAQNRIRKLEIDNESHYSIEETGKPALRSTYEIFSAKDTNTGVVAMSILFYDEARHPIICQLYIRKDSNQLILKDNVPGYYTHYYVKE
jgi:hypothetical protein